MAFGGSGFFTQSLVDRLDGTAQIDWGTATWNIALFNDTATPDFTVTAANSAYGAGVWASNEVTGSGWSAGGPVLVTATPVKESPAAGQVILDATDVSETATTLDSAEGCLLYMGSLASPVVDQGLIVVDFGAAYSTTNGTFAVTWDSNGVAYFDVW
jgi:hypothetical protein